MSNCSEGPVDDEPKLIVEVAWGTGKKQQVHVRFGSALVHTDKIDLASDTARSRVGNAVVRKVGTQTGTNPTLAADVEAELLSALAQRMEAEAGDSSGAFGTDPGEHHVVDDGDQSGIYRRGRDGGDQRLTNFSMRVERDVEIQDEVQNGRTFEGVISLGGVNSHFAIGATDFADNRRLSALIYSIAGPKAQLLVDPAKIRNAVSDLSRSAVHDRRTTAAGCNSVRDLFSLPEILFIKSSFALRGGTWS